MASSTVSYQCPNCRAALLFAPEKSAFTCEFCLSEFMEIELEQTGAAEAAAAEQARAEDFCEHMQEFRCPNCGAEVMAELHTAADFCSYCHNPVLLRGRMTGQMKPDKVIPFRIGKQEAEDAFLAFARKKKFVPRDFFAPAQTEKIKGIYYPFWVTDADTDATLHAKATRVRVWTIGNVRYTETSNFRVKRQGEIHFEDISTAALTEADKAMLEGILPYPSDSLVDFTMSYLSGFLAKKRNIERRDLSGEVKGRMEDYSRQLLRNSVQGYHSVQVSGCDMRIWKSHWDYTLLPLWLLVYRGRKRSYTYAMNGYTGKIYGELPISAGRLGGFLGILFVLLAAVLTAGGMWLL